MSAGRVTEAWGSARTARSIAAFVVVVGFAPGAWSAPAGKAEGSFIAENAAAMSTMMNDMTIKPTGNVDADFVAMMIPHHQGAIDMAEAELRYGHNEHLRRIAQEIVVEQQQEIVAMRLALAQPLPPSQAAPTGPTAAPDQRAATSQAPAPTGSMHPKTETSK